MKIIKREQYSNGKGSVFPRLRYERAITEMINVIPRRLKKGEKKE